MRRIIRCNEKDNVAILLDDLKQGERITVDGQEVTALEDIPYGHKIALEDMKAGSFVRKYGENVARVTKEIKTGEWVHVHNVESIRGLGR